MRDITHERWREHARYDEYRRLAESDCDEFAVMAAARLCRAQVAEVALDRVRALHIKQDRPVKSWTLCDKHRRPPLNIPGRAEIEECAGCSYIDRWVCMHCNCPDDEWPCATVRALDGDEQASETADLNLETGLQERGISAGRKADPNIPSDERRIQ